MINRFTITVFIFLFIGIKHVYPQESRLQEIHSSKGYILVIWAKNCFILFHPNIKTLIRAISGLVFEKKTTGEDLEFIQCQILYLAIYGNIPPNFREDSLKIYGSENKRSILLMPIKITYTGAIINEHKEQKKLDEVERFKYFKKHRIGEKYLSFDNGMKKHFIYDWKGDREIIDIKMLSRPL